GKTRIAAAIISIANNSWFANEWRAIAFFSSSLRLSFLGNFNCSEENFIFSAREGYSGREYSLQSSQSKEVTSNLFSRELPSRIDLKYSLYEIIISDVF